MSVTYGSDTPILGSTAGIIDVGTTLVLLATDAFEAYKTATGAVLDDATGMLKITNDQYTNLQSLFFTRFNVSNRFLLLLRLHPCSCLPRQTNYEFVPNAQIWPRSVRHPIAPSSVELTHVPLLAQHRDWRRRRQHLPRCRGPGFKERRRPRLHQRLCVARAFLHCIQRDDEPAWRRDHKVHEQH